MMVTLPYGTSGIKVDLPDNVAWEHALPDLLAPLVNPQNYFQRALAEPIGAPPLAAIVAGKKRPVILVSGKDRLTLAHEFLPVMLETLAGAGVALANVAVIIATGTHDPHAREEIQDLVGDGVVDRVEIISHNPRDAGMLVTVGRSASGNEIALNKRYVESDLRIATGRITHHYFAGLTGGRKAILPGVAGYDTIRLNHRKVLEDAVAHPDPAERRCRPGSLEGNPVHEEMMEAAAMAPPDFLLNTVLNVDGSLAALFAGDWREAHARGCAFVGGHFVPRVDGPVDVVLASCGGHPYDLSLIQMMKTVFNHCALVRDGGTFIVAGACPEGVRKGFDRWDVAGTSLDEMGRHILDRYDLPGHNVYLIRELTRRIHVIVVGAPHGDIARVGLTPAATVAEAIAIARDRCPRRRRDATRGLVIPWGNVTSSSPL